MGLGPGVGEPGAGVAFGDGVGSGVGFGVGFGVGLGVGFGVTRGVGLGVGFGVGLGVGFGFGGVILTEAGLTFVSVTVRSPGPLPDVAWKR